MANRKFIDRRVLSALSVSMLLHVLFIVLWNDSDDQAVRYAPILAPQEFVKRPLPPRRPLARSTRPLQPQRPLIRYPLSRTTRVIAQSPPALAMRQTALEGRPIPLIIGRPPPVVARLASLPTPNIGPKHRVGPLNGEYRLATEIDLGIELLDIDALDTGQHRALVVIDPNDRRGLKGFLYLSSVYSDAIERSEAEAPVGRYAHIAGHTDAFFGPVRRQVAERRTLKGLAEELSQRTQVRAQVLDGLALDDPQLLQTPFLLLTVHHTFNFTQREAASLGHYLNSGGFLFADIVAPPPGRVFDADELDIPALRAFIRAAMYAAGHQEGHTWRFVRLSQEHPLYHCYYDIDSLPLGIRDYEFWGSRPNLTPPYLEGIEVEGHIVGLYCLKNYADFWGGVAEEIREIDRRQNFNGRFSHGGEEVRVYDLGVNILVYAMTREGSLAQRLVSVE